MVLILMGRKMIVKPELKQAEQRANQLYHYLKDGRTVTKAQICEIYRWGYNSNNDRRVREIIALLGSKKPIIATSDKKGYKLCQTKEEAQHQYNELLSRIHELQKRLPPLEKYLTIGSLY